MSMAMAITSPINNSEDIVCSVSPPPYSSDADADNETSDNENMNTNTNTNTNMYETSNSNTANTIKTEGIRSSNSKVKNQQQKQEQKDEEKGAEPNIFNDSSKKPLRMTSADDYTMLEEGYKPDDEDVICSWARQNHSHPGNEKFRQMINEYAPTYLNVNTKYQKSEVIAKIVAEVRNKSSPGVGFVKKDFYSNRWFEVGDEKARDKVGHAIRKAATELGKKIRGGKRQPQSLQKRRMKNKNIKANGNDDLLDQQQQQQQQQQQHLNAMNSASNIFNKAAIMNGMNMNGMNMNLDGIGCGAGNNTNGNFSGMGGMQMSNDLALASMNMNMNSMNSMNMNGLMNPINMGNIGGVGGSSLGNALSNMRGSSGLMSAMGGMNGMGMGLGNMGGMTSNGGMRDIEGIMAINRLRANLASNGGGGGNAPGSGNGGGIDPSHLGGLYSNAGGGNGVGSAGGVGFNIEEAAMMESLQRRRILVSAAQKEKQALDMLQESKELTILAQKQMNSSSSNSGNNIRSISSSDNSSFGEFNPNNLTSAGGALANDSNSSNIGVGGGLQGDIDISGDGLDSISRREILSKLAGNSKISDQLFNNNNDIHTGVAGAVGSMLMEDHNLSNSTTRFDHSNVI